METLYFSPMLLGLNLMLASAVACTGLWYFSRPYRGPGYWMAGAWTLPILRASCWRRATQSCARLRYTDFVATESFWQAAGGTPCRDAFSGRTQAAPMSCGWERGLISFTESEYPAGIISSVDATPGSAT